jgi:GNAT superfamily N-acetyltransferase
MSELRGATEGDLPRVLTTLGLAFADDPMLRWPLRPGITPEELGRSLEGIVRAHLGAGTLRVAEDGGGVAAWLPPDLVARFADMFEESAQTVLRFAEDGGARYRAFWDWVDEHLPAGPMWFLDFVAVDPVLQGRGLGTALIRHGLDRARADGVPAVLETAIASNVALYEGLGFHVAEEADAPDGGPHLWFLHADPA